MARQTTRLPEARDLREIVAARLCQAQAAKEMQTEELARAVGLGLRLVQKHRAGNNMPTIANLARYGRILNRDVSWFFRVDDDEKEEAVLRRVAEELVHLGHDALAADLQRLARAGRQQSQSLVGQR